MKLIVARLATVRRRRLTASAAAVIFSAATVLVILGFPVTAVLLTAFSILVWLGTPALIPVLVFATFITRFRVEIGGVHFLPEHLLVLALLCAIVLERKATAWLATIKSPVVLALAAFIVWEGVVSLARAPDPIESLHIVGWLGLDWLLLVSIVSSVGTSARLELLAIRSATVLAAIALAVWLAYVLGPSSIGTQGGYEGGGRAVFGLSFEANILASTLAVWAFVALSSTHQRVRSLSRVFVPLALGGVAVSLTRSAIVGFFLALLIWAALGGGYIALRRVVVATLAVILVGGVVFAISPDTFDPLQRRAENLLQIGSGTGGARVAASETAIGDLGDLNFLTGLGTDSFGQRHVEPTQPDQPAYLSALPLQILYDSGVVGLALLGFAFVNLHPFAAGRRGRALGVTVVYLVTSSATSPFWFGWTWILLALAIMTIPEKPPVTAKIKGETSSTSPLRRRESAAAEVG